MERSIWKKWGRHVVSGMLGTAILLGNVLPARASDAPVTTPAISPWSVATLHEGEKYGIFPLEWYYDGTFQQPITAGKFLTLTEATAAKLDKLGLNKKEKPTAPAAETTLTREAVLKSLYGILTQFELPSSFEIDAAAPVAYLQSKGIVQGTASGLELDKPCTVEQAAVLASRLVQYAYETADGGAKGLMWKVTEGGNTLYLLGSIHLGIPEMYPLHRSVTDAFEASDDLWVEANLLTDDQEALAYFAKLTMYSDGTTLKDHLSADTYEKLQKVMTKLGMPAQSFDALKPWVVSNSLSLTTLMEKPEDLAQATNAGVDLFLTQIAMMSGKPVRELEGMKLQGDILSGTPEEQQARELDTMLDSMLNPDAAAADNAVQFKNWQLLWAKGDLAGFAKSYSASLQQEQNNGLTQRLLGERDQNMAIKLTELLEAQGSSTHFIVVGAAHLAIKDMVIDKLKQKGYDVQFVE
ncbi:TraB/GumN family protein [Paenibacillus ginsengarvi]|uniref:TraB/GumN family protein n=1 Tax=Paenibacillus ginsengarvi TaxID=400777 RepID=A0A3B0BNL3_9BACL|nr:TraB/GumN family protein [Paenibacillus ginsengarvi]RKN74965.1 TraB/GumN family protein [Paenibacillus ginsengarvi]